MAAADPRRPRTARIGARAMTARAQLASFVSSHIRARQLDFRSAELAAADLSGLCGDALDFSGADMRSARLNAVHLVHCPFVDARLERAVWTSSVLRRCRLDRCNGSDGCFDRIRFEDSSATGAELSSSHWHSAQLSESTFDRAVLRNARFDDASGDGVVFRGADLLGASLIGVRFEDADFRGADLRGAELSGGVFHHADFRGALLDGVALNSADLSGALFDADVLRSPSKGSGADRAGAATVEANGGVRPAAATANVLPLDFETLLADLIRQLQGGTLAPSPLLAELLGRAGIAPTQASGEAARRLQLLLLQLQTLSNQADTPEAMLAQCQALLQQVLGEQDWQALSDLIK